MQPEWQGTAGEYLALRGQDQGQGQFPQQQPLQPAPPTQLGQYAPGGPPPVQGAAPVGGSLGEVTSAAQGAPVPAAQGSPVAGQFQQAYQLALQAYAPAMRPPKQAPQRSIGGTIGNLLMFGMPGLYEHDAMVRENRKIEEGNRNIQMKAADTAFSLVEHQQAAQNAGFSQMMAMLNYQNGVQRLQMENDRLIADQNRNAAKDERDRLTQNTVPLPKSVAEFEALDAQGLEVVPAPGMPGRGIQQRKGGGGVGSPAPAAGSPLGDALGSTPPPGEAGSAAPSGRRPDESPADYLRRRDEEKTAGKAEARASVPTASTRTRMESAPKVRKLVAEIETILPTVKTGPIASRWQEFTTGKLGFSNPAFTKYRTATGLLQTLLMNMHVGSRGGEYFIKKFSDLLDYGKASPENMRAALEEIKTYADMVESKHGEDIDPDEYAQGHGTSTTTPTTSTTSTTTPGTAAPSAAPKRMSAEEFLAQ